MKEITTKKLLDTIIEGIRNRKGQRIVTIDLRKIKEAPVEMMLICEGQSNTQVSAIADEIDDFVRTTTHVHPLSVSGQENAEWIAMDYGTIFVHIMQREPRAFYDIEHLWVNRFRYSSAYRPISSSSRPSCPATAHLVTEAP